MGSGRMIKQRLSASGSRKQQNPPAAGALPDFGKALDPPALYGTGIGLGTIQQPRNPLIYGLLRQPSSTSQVPSGL